MGTAPERNSGSLPSTEEKGPGDLDESSAKLTAGYISTEQAGTRLEVLGPALHSLYSCVLNSQQLL